MPDRRATAGRSAICLLMTLIAWGCSGADDGGQPAVQLVASDFQFSSPNFTEIRPKVRIPPGNTCYGENLSPPLEWSGAPEGTQSLALTAEDVDHPTGSWAHWVLYNVPPTVTELAEGIPTSTAQLPDGTVQGSNDFKHVGYEGPCPTRNTIDLYAIFGDKPSSEPAHKYVFTIYALDTKVRLPPGANREQLLSEIEGHVLARADTVGKFQVAPITEAKQDIGGTIHGGTPTPTAP